MRLIAGLLSLMLVSVGTAQGMHINAVKIDGTTFSFQDSQRRDFPVFVNVTTIDGLCTKLAFEYDIVDCLGTIRGQLNFFEDTEKKKVFYLLLRFKRGVCVDDLVLMLFALSYHMQKTFKKYAIHWIIPGEHRNIIEVCRRSRVLQEYEFGDNVAFVVLPRGTLPVVTKELSAGEKLPTNDWTKKKRSRWCTLL